MDVRLIWSNSFYYNAKGSDLYHMTMELSTLFEKLMKGNESLILVEKQDIVQDLYRKLEKLSKGIRDIQNNSSSTTTKVQVKPQTEKAMTLQEKKQLCQNIKKLDPKFLRGVLDIVQECMDVQGEELEFDIDKLPSKVCRELERYVKQCLQNPSKPPTKKKPESVEPVKTAQESTSNRLKDLDSQLQQLVQQTRSEPQQQTYQPPEESESESSSTSESEEEEDLPAPSHNMSSNLMDTDIIPHSMWENHFQESMDVDHDFTTGAFSGMMDFDKSHDLFK